VTKKKTKEVRCIQHQTCRVGVVLVSLFALNGVVSLFTCVLNEEWWLNKYLDGVLVS